jgi:hypothetical protein
MKPSWSGLGLVAGILISSSSANQLEYTAYHIIGNEDIPINGTSFNLAEALWQRAVLLLDIEMDRTTFPPLSPDATSGASRPARHASEPFSKNRGQFIIGLEQGLGDNFSITGNYYHSREIDYLSHSFIGSLKQDLLQKNLTLELRGQYTMDSVGEIPKTGGLINRFKERHDLNFAMTQLLSPVMVLRLGADARRDHVFLSDPYRTLDRYPDMRWGQAAWGELKRYLYLVNGSVSAHYRYYWDDWNLTSHTIKIEFGKYIGNDVIFSPQYRYYTQSGVDLGPGFHTSDRKLTAFDANTVEGELTWMLRTLGRNHPKLDFLTETSVSLLYFRYWQSNSYAANVLQGRLKFEF